MKAQFYLYRRKDGSFYCQNRDTGKQESLGTKNKAEATLLVNARNEAHRQPILNLQLARTYLSATDPQAAKRTWLVPLEEMARCKRGDTKDRWGRVLKDPALEELRNLPLLLTRPEHLLSVMKLGTVSTNVFLRRVHNFALDMGWLPWPVIPKRQWPKFHYGEKRAITLEEHEAILAKVLNEQQRAFYQLCWHLGGAQGDIAGLTAESVDWKSQVVGFARRKTGTISMIHFGDDVATVLRTLPNEGLLFPKIAKMQAGHRATEFARARRRAGIKGVSLHSYRYAWAERARKAHYPRRQAEEALGHNSKAVHIAYAKRAQVTVDSLEDYEDVAAKKVLRVEFGGGENSALPAARS